MENLVDLWIEEDLYELIDDYLVAINRPCDEIRFQQIKRNFEMVWDVDASNRMIEHMINTVYNIGGE